MYATVIQRHLGRGFALGALALAGCRPADRAVTAAEPKTLLQVAQARALVRTPVTAEEFSNRNAMGWTGQAHNRFLAEALPKLAAAAPKDRCGILALTLLSGKWLAGDNSRISGQQRIDFSRQAMSAAPGCSGRITPDGRVVAYRRPMMFDGDMTPFMDAIAGAVPVASSSTQLATTLQVITDSAARVLSGYELDAVNAAASFTVSSAQYWESNGDAQVDALASGPTAECIASTMNVDSCVYAARALRVRPNGPIVRTVAFTPMAAGFCPYRWNGWAVTSADLGGFMGGLMTVSVGGGVFVGAVASASAFAAEAGREVYCRVTHQQ